MKTEKELESVAEKARETYVSIRKLRKEHPIEFAWQRRELEEKIKKLQDDWWEEVKHTFIRPNPGSVREVEDESDTEEIR